MSGFGEEQARFEPMPVEDLGEDDLFDMANLPRKDTGVDGTIFVSTAIGRHGPRIKWYPSRPGRDEPCLKITLEDPPRVINHGVPSRLAASAGEAAREWAAVNREAPLRFWTEGAEWLRDDVNAFLEGLRKLPG